LFDLHDIYHYCFSQVFGLKAEHAGGGIAMKTINSSSVALIITILVIGITGCATVPQKEFHPVTTLHEFVPIDPLPFETVSYTKPDGTKVKGVSWAAIPSSTIRSLLPNQEAFMTTYKLAASGDIRYLTSNVSAEAGVYRVIMDYVQYRVEDIYDEDGDKIGIGRVGIGMRIKANIETLKSGVDLGSLLALGVAARLGQVRGSLTVAVLGLQSPEITTLFPTPSEINETSIQKSLEALAAIKSKIGDNATLLTPQIVSVKTQNAGSKMAVILDDRRA
jgi:hypothetical protein